jgi:hypothetical protein
MDAQVPCPDEPKRRYDTEICLDAVSKDVAGDLLAGPRELAHVEWESIINGVRSQRIAKLVSSSWRPARLGAHR